MRLALTLIWLLAGCGFPCEEGESKCSANGIAVCNAYGDWEIGLCCAQDGCREVDGPHGRFATCTPSDQPDPRCDGAEPIDEICVGNARLTCTFGYGAFEERCDGVCVRQTPGVALCALDDQLDPRCSDRQLRHLCMGDRILDCEDGFAIAERLCEAPFTECILVPDNLGHHPRCATQVDPLGECAVDSPGRCAGNEIFGCTGGRKTHEHCEFSCFENPIDSMFPEAFCEGPPCDDGV